MPRNYVLEAIKSRRAIRSYEDKPVPESAIETMLEAAIYAPSAINIQPWKFTIVTSKTEMKRLSDIAKPALLRTLPDAGNQALSALKKSLSDPKYNIFYEAPLLIFVSGEKSRFGIYDCSMAAQNMMLTAYSLGIGSCWIGTAVALANEPKMKIELGIPEDHEVHAAIIFGYPRNGFPQSPPKRPAEVLKRIT
ncbi:MAG: nitroreductase [Candidatus Bathyarchaeia archaeon]|jgi:nitroreductase